MASMVIQQIVVDCADPEALAGFWGAVLDCPWGPTDDSWAVVGSEPVLLCFQKVPEPKSSPKNRLHLDILVENVDDALLRATRAGGRVLRDFETEESDGGGFVVLADPEDNEFCFVTDPSGIFENRMRASLTRGHS